MRLRHFPASLLTGLVASTLAASTLGTSTFTGAAFPTCPLAASNVAASLLAVCAKDGLSTGLVSLGGGLLSRVTLRLIFSFFALTSSVSGRGKLFVDTCKINSCLLRSIPAVGTHKIFSRVVTALLSTWTTFATERPGG